MPLREVSEIDEIIVNRITDIQFKQSFLNKKPEKRENQKSPHKIGSNEMQLGLQQHNINLIYNSSSSSSSSECNSVNSSNIHTKKSKCNKTNNQSIKNTSFNDNEIAYVESSGSEVENKNVKKKSKIGNSRYNIVNIDDAPALPPQSMKRRIFPIEIDESSLLALNNTINVPPNAVAQSFINKIKKLRRST